MKKYFSAGVFKLDINRANYEELKAEAEKWSLDKCFHVLIIRKVSEKNYGIQFVYISNDESSKGIKDYEEKLINKFGNLESIDYCEHSTEESINDITDGIIAIRTFKK